MYNSGLLWMNTRINWPAIENARSWFKEEFAKELAREIEQHGVGCISDAWCNWILENAGIENTTTSIRIVDEQQYMLFLLRWS